MMEKSDNTKNDSKQLHPGLWVTVNERYSGSMTTKGDFVPLAKLKKPLSGSGLTFVSTAGVQPQGTLSFDTVHPIGDYTFHRVPSGSKPINLEIHQLKYPAFSAERDLNIIFPIERLQKFAKEKVVRELTRNFFSFIGYNMDTERLEKTLPMRSKRKTPMRQCRHLPDRFAIGAARRFSAPLREEEFRRFQYRSRST